MPLPTELARHLTEEKIAFVQRSGLRAEVLEPGYVRLRMPAPATRTTSAACTPGRSSPSPKFPVARCS